MALLPDSDYPTEGEMAAEYARRVDRIKRFWEGDVAEEGLGTLVAWLWNMRSSLVGHPAVVDYGFTNQLYRKTPNGKGSIMKSFRYPRTWEQRRDRIAQITNELNCRMPGTKERSWP